MKYKPTIGLEIHIQLNTKSKMFCSCKNDPFSDTPNSNTCPICLAHPGALPTINKEAVKKVIQSGLALNCDIAQFSKFDRKNYFYPDLPKGYQISQYDKPLCTDGYLMIKGHKVRITRIHLEEDTGKLSHKEKETLIDFNRAGVPLMELVTEPDIQTSEQAKDFAKELQNILRYIGVSNADMDKGEMRVEVNISLSETEVLGTKVEIKNIGSITGAKNTIEYEIKRQSELLDKGEKILHETRGWDAIKQITVSQRLKETSADYRYFPEPDLPMLDTQVFNVAELKENLPELPRQKRERFISEYNLSEEEAQILIDDRKFANYYEQVISELEDRSAIKLAGNYLLSDFRGLIEGEYNITAENFAELIVLIKKGEINSSVAKQVLQIMYHTKKDPSDIIEEQGLSQMSDLTEIKEIAQKIIENNKEPVDDYKKGKENAITFLLGQLMRETKGRINPKEGIQILKDLL